MIQKTKKIIGDGKMKKAIKWVGFFVVAVVCMLSIAVLSACNDNETPEKIGRASCRERVFITV